MDVTSAREIEPDDIGIIHLNLLEGYVAVRVSEISSGRIVYPFIITNYTHSPTEDFEVFVRPGHEEYEELHQQVLDAEAEGKLVELNDEDVERLTAELEVDP